MDEREAVSKQRGQLIGRETPRWAGIGGGCFKIEESCEAAAGPDQLGHAGRVGWAALRVEGAEESPLADDIKGAAVIVQEKIAESDAVGEGRRQATARTGHCGGGKIERAGGVAGGGKRGEFVARAAAGDQRSAAVRMAGNVVEDGALHSAKIPRGVARLVACVPKFGLRGGGGHAWISRTERE